MAQTAGHLAKYPEYFYQFIGDILEERGESYESVIRNVAEGDLIIDDIIIQVIAQMFQLKITVVFPMEETCFKFHSASYEDSDIVLINNGKGHFSGTSEYI